MTAELAELERRWRLYPPPAATPAQIEELLVGQYNAYAIPMSLIPANELAADDEVHADEVLSLYTITDPAVLARIFSASERDMHQEVCSEDPVALEQAWRDAFAEPDGLAFGVMWLQVARGQRALLLLEGDTERITGFKVYGGCQELVDVLAAHIGWERYSTPHPLRPEWDVVRVGDAGDETFARYLRTVDRLGLWSDGK